MTLTEEEKRKIEEEEKFRAEARVRAEAKTVKKSKSGSSGCLGVILLVFTVLVLIGLLKDSSKTPEQKAQEKINREDKYCNNDNTMAFVMAKDFVEKSLKAPSTASFPWTTLDSEITNIGDCTYTVRSYVDSENSFGAKVRTSYFAKIKYMGNEEWRALNINFDN